MPKEKKAKIEKKNGVTLAPWDGHKVYKWRVFFTADGKRRNRGFKTKSGKDGAQYFADRLRGDITSDGTRHKGITDDERRAVMTFREKASELAKVGEVVTLSEVVKDWCDRQDPETRQETVRSMIDRYLDYLDVKKKRRGGGKLSDVYKRTIRQRLEPFRLEFGDWTASTITDEILRDWLDGLRKVKARPSGAGSRGEFGKRGKGGKPLSARSKNHFRAALGGLFDFGLKQKVVRKNPVKDVEELAVEDSEIGVLSPGDAEALLAACDEVIVPAVAIGLFAGLRRAEILRADWEDVDLEEGEIVVPYSQATKNQATREVIVSANLRAWLGPYGRFEGKIVPSEGVYRKRLEKAIKEAGIDWPKNALRHSFASYHYSLHKDKTLLREQMGHEAGSKTLERHYKRRLPSKLAKYYWGIMPGDQKGKITKLEAV